MKKDEGYLWIGPEFMKRLARDFEPTSCVGFMVLASYVNARGEMDYQNAVDALVAADREVDENKARDIIANFITKGLASGQGEVLILTGCGTDFIPNQKHRPRD